jgi:hypothetical protein
MEMMEARLEPFRPPLLLVDQPSNCADLARMPLRSLLYFVLTAEEEDRKKPRQ